MSKTCYVVNAAAMSVHYENYSGVKKDIMDLILAEILHACLLGRLVWSGNLLGREGDCLGSGVGGHVPLSARRRASTGDIRFLAHGHPPGSHPLFQTTPMIRQNQICNVSLCLRERDIAAIQ